MNFPSDRFRDPAVLAVGALAVHRLTGLVTSDEVTREWRERIAAPESRLAYFLTCPRCVSVWVAAAWVGLAAAAPRTARVAGAALAWSAVTGVLSSLE